MAAASSCQVVVVCKRGFLALQVRKIKSEFLSKKKFYLAKKLNKNHSESLEIILAELNKKALSGIALISEESERRF